MHPLQSRSSCAAVIFGIAGLVAMVAPPSTPAQSTPAPLVRPAQAEEIPGDYIVVLKGGRAAADVDRVERRAQGRGGRVKRQYRRALNGFSATLNDAALAEVRSDPDVSFVEADAVVTASVIQSPATFGLDRIDQRSLPLTSSYEYTATGSGVTAYVIDTGIRTTHTEFGGRAVSGFDAVDGGAADDCNGHGTHVAGTVGSTTYGVAKQAQLVAVRVLDCQGNGTNSGVIAGINWVTGNHAAGTPAVANMSLGGGKSAALDTAVRNSIADGITYALAAGNENANACNSSPGRTAEALTVGSTTSTDARSSFSNFGTCLDLFAPGSGITSAWHTSNTATNTISGTSMAAPHVAGVAALYLQGQPGAQPAAVNAAIIDGTTASKVTNPGTGSPNRLLYSLFGAAPPPPPPGCGLAQSYNGSLSGTGASVLLPSATGYSTTKRGTHRACLTGPAGADFDLELYKLNAAGNWKRVAQSAGATSTESITHTGPAGTYRVKVLSRSGAGAYQAGITTPP